MHELAPILGIFNPAIIEKHSKLFFKQNKKNIFLKKIIKTL